MHTYITVPYLKKVILIPSPNHGGDIDVLKVEEISFIDSNLTKVA